MWPSNPNIRYVCWENHNCKRNMYSNVHFKIQSVQSLSGIRLFATAWTAAHQAFLFITNSQSLLKLMSTEFMMRSNYLIFCHPLPNSLTTHPLPQPNQEALLERRAHQIPTPLPSFFKLKSNYSSWMKSYHSSPSLHNLPLHPGSFPNSPNPETMFQNHVYLHSATEYQATFF